MSKPAAVIISDVHYNLKNLDLSDAAMKAAINYAEKNKLPVIVAGDLHDTKAMMRGEVVARMIETFNGSRATIYVLAGNHDRINEKSLAHSLEFLRPYCGIIDVPTKLLLNGLNWWMIPYHSESEELKLNYKKGSVLIMHQGVRQGDKGEYVYDRSAIDVARLSDFRCISGHYHRHHTVENLTYCGSPFTMSFAEANDGPKGFLVVNEDGTFKQVPLNYRKHIIWNVSVGDDVLGCLEYMSTLVYTPEDLVWIKLSGLYCELDTMPKSRIASYIGRSDFKLDKIPVDSVKPKQKELSKLTGEQILDKLIDSLTEKAPHKKYLKKLWREIV